MWIITAVMQPQELKVIAHSVRKNILYITANGKMLCGWKKNRNRTEHVQKHKRDTYILLSFIPLASDLCVGLRKGTNSLMTFQSTCLGVIRLHNDLQPNHKSRLKFRFCLKELKNREILCRQCSGSDNSLSVLPTIHQHVCINVAI